MRWICVNTWLRMSNIRPSPTREEIQRSQRPSPASKTAKAATAMASSTTTVESLLPTSSLMIARVNSGFDGPDQRVDDDQDQEQRQRPPCTVWRSPAMRLTIPLGSLWSLILSSWRMERMRPYPTLAPPPICIMTTTLSRAARYPAAF